MKIAYLVHFYPPTPCGGAGYYTAAMAEGLRAAGAEVNVLCLDRWGEGAAYFNGHVDEVINGVPVRRLHVNWLKAPRPADWLYDSPVIGEQARIFLNETRPDVVHVSSSYGLSIRPVQVAKELGYPIVMHQHDYWQVCARHTLLQKDDTICSGPESAWKCQACQLTGTKAWRASAWLGQRGQQALFTRLSQTDAATRLPSLRGMLGNFERRRDVTLAAARSADVLITPTRFARDLLGHYGLPADRIRVMPYGNRVEWTAGLQHTSADRLRIGFLGNVIRIKGVHVLIDAFRQLNAPDRAELAIWGDLSLEPDYVQQLRAAAPANVTWGGRYTRADLPRMLGALDVLVVPSIWYETQGIVIQEAYAAGVPVLVSAGTTLTESVQPDVSGLHFELGNASDLARQLRRLISDPALLPRLRSGIPPIRLLETDVAELQTLYQSLMHK